MRTEQANWFRSAAERAKITRGCGRAAALGWLLLELCFELLFGPHVRLVRALALGSGIGAAAGLLASALQWRTVRGHLRDVDGWMPATAGMTLAGLFSGLLLYFVNQHVEFYRWNLPLQGALGAFLVGAASAQAQWGVLRHGAGSAQSRRRWAAITTAGAALGAVAACLATAAILRSFDPLLDVSAWPYLMVAAYLGAGLAGGAVYGRFVTWGLRAILPGTSESVPHPLSALQRGHSAAR